MMAVELSAPDPMPIESLSIQWFSTLHEIRYQEQVVKRLLLAGSLFVVFGESNSGKTFWMLDLCLAVAAGQFWRGRPTRRGLVIYVAGEGSASVRARIAAYRASRPDVADALPFAIVPQPVDFLDPVSVESLIKTVRDAESESGEKAALVIVDTFARAIANGDENSSQDVGIAVAAADRIRAQIGCCVGFVHHAGKDPAKGARGSSALRAATDTEILIEGTQGVRTASVTKQRDLECGEPMPFELVVVPLGHDDDGELTTSCIVKHVDGETEASGQRTFELRGRAQRQYLAALRARAKDEPSRIWTLVELREVGRHAGMTKSTARSVVDTLTASPYMVRALGGYRFTDGRVEG